MGAAPDDFVTNQMRAIVLSGQFAGSLEFMGPRSVAELKEAATHFERAAELHTAPAVKAQFAGNAAWCRSEAAAV